MRAWIAAVVAVGGLAGALAAAGHEVEPPPPSGPSSAALSDVPCENGFADVYPCENVDLLAYVPLSALGESEGANDIWGWRDPLTGREIVLLGLREGTAFLDVSDPTAPVHLGFLPSHTSSSVWRDIRTIGRHALVVSEAPGHGMQVFDLGRLAQVQSPPEVFTADAHYDLFGDAHNVSVHEQTGFAYVVGSDTCSRGLHMIDVEDPLSPSFAGCFAEDGYTHDVQCVVYHGADAEHQGKEICLASNEDALTIVDVTDKLAPIQLSRTGYAGSAYVHQGWITPWHDHFLLGDELDERDHGHDARTYVWDLADLDRPELVGFHQADTPAVDHNLFVFGGHVHQAHYEAGVRFRRLGNLADAELGEVAFFDTAPEGDAVTFSGVWGVYPFFPSGTVAASDRGRGLFLLAPDLEAVPQCADGLDNDGDGLRDADGGLAALGPDHPDLTGPDPECVDMPERDVEAAPARCGLGGELALLLPLLELLRRRFR